MNLSIPYLNKSKFYIVLLCAGLISSCFFRHSKVLQLPFQGVVVKINIRQGNFTTDGNIGTAGRIFSDSTKGYIYQLTGIPEVEYKGDFLTTINSDFVVKFVTDEQGKFKIQLPPGQYSLFIEYQQQSYSELVAFQNDFYFFPFEVIRDSTTYIEYNINLGVVVE